MLFFFYCEKSFAAPSNFYFMKYGLKWLCKCERLPTLALDPASIDMKKVHSRVTERVVNTQEPSRRKTGDEIQPLSQEATSQLRSNRNFAVVINRKRKQVHCVPVVPNLRNGFAISKECARTLGGENFLLYNSGKRDEERILIFGTRMMVDLLSRYHHWFVNGTFSVTPNIFYQVLPCMYW